MTVVKLPDEIMEFMQTFKSRLIETLPDLFTGLYLHGSICLEAYQSDLSDLDFVVILGQEPTIEENQHLEILHNQLLKETKMARKLEGVYTTRNWIKYVDTESVNPVFLKIEDGKAAGTCDGRLGVVDLYLLKHKGITLYGESLAPHIQVSTMDLLREMKGNVENYWQDKLQHPEIFQHNGWIEFGVSTISRIRYTLQFGEVISKLQAMNWLLHLPEMQEEDQKVIQEAIKIRSVSGSSMYENQNERKQQVTKFMNKQIQICKKVISKIDFN